MSSDPFAAAAAAVAAAASTATTTAGTTASADAAQAMTVPVGAETRLKREVDKDEALLTNTLAARMQSMQVEANKLNAAKKELERLGFDHRRDIDELRQRIEQNSRELSYANANLRQKAKEHAEAKEEVAALDKAKMMMTEHLRVIIYENEKRKKKKLEEIMKRVGLEGSGGGGSAPASPQVTSKPPPAGESSASRRKSSGWSGF
jgi:TolA-binding protein